MQKDITCKKGEYIYGMFKMKTNPSHWRDLDIDIQIDFDVSNDF